MTIDEAVKTLRECEISCIHGNKFPNISKEEREHNTKCAEEYAELVDWLKELHWYRSQNLIRREDIKEYFHFENIDDNVRLFACWKDIEQIPKAEYIGE